MREPTTSNYNSAPQTPKLSSATKKKKYYFQNEKEIVWNVYNYLKREHIQGKILDNVAKATGVGRSTVARIIKDGRKLVCGDKNFFISMRKHIVQPSPKFTVDECAKEGIRWIVYSFHKTQKQKPTILAIFAKERSGGYYDDMNFKNYSRWMETQLIPNLPSRSVVVMDNASYHNVVTIKHPTANTNKRKMLAWLDEQGIHYVESLTKPLLYSLIRKYKPDYINNSTDAFFSRYGHKLCRLPPYHPELNPIEMIWSNVKQWVGARNVTFKLADIEKLARKKFQTVGQAESIKMCRYVVDIKSKYIEREHIIDMVCDGLVITTNTSSSDKDVFDWLDD